MNRKVILMFITLLTVLVVMGISYAFFTAIVSGGDTGSSIIIKTGSLRVLYEDGQKIETSNAMPGTSFTKDISVTNEGDVMVNYDLVWIELVNTFINKSDLVMSMTCTSSINTCNGYNETEIASSGSNVPIMYGIELDPLEVHEYHVTITFKETGSNQDNNQGKILNGKIGIIESGQFNVKMYGKVYGSNGYTINNSIVYLHSEPISTMTDSNGYYEFDNVILGEHNVTVGDGSETIFSKDITINYSDTTSVESNILLVPSKEVIIGVDLIDDTIPLAINEGIAGTLRSKAADQNFYQDDIRTKITYITLDDRIDIPADSISVWDVSKVDGTSEVMAYIVSDGISGYHLHIQSFNEIFAPENSTRLFSEFTSLKLINNIMLLNTSRVTNMFGMFLNDEALESLNVSRFDTSKVTDMSFMFQNLKTITYLNVRNFNTSQVTSMNGMFYGLVNLEHLDLSDFRTGKVTNMSYMFCDMKKLVNLDVSRFDTSNVTTMAYMFLNVETIPELNLQYFVTSKLTIMTGMFSSVKSIPKIDISNFDTSHVTNMSYLFANCNGLTNLNVDIDTSNVENMSYMFSSVNYLTTVDLSSFNTSNVTNMRGMFTYMSRLTALNLINFHTEKVTDMSEMFSGVVLVTNLDLSNFNPNVLTNTSKMFQNTYDLVELNLGHFDTSKIDSYTKMFDNVNSNIEITALDATTNTFINDRLVDDGIINIVN